MIFDPMYLLVMAPVLLFALWAQWKVKSAYRKMSQVRVSSGLTGAQVAQRIMKSNDLHHVRIEQVQGVMSDHYDPRKKVLRLSPDVYNGQSIAAVGIAAHEAGHAIQDQVHYKPLKFRNAIVPTASFGSNAAFYFILGGMIFSSMRVLVLVGAILYCVVAIFQIINLPVEFNASSRARKILTAQGIIAPAEDQQVGKVLNAAAMTYVAATISAIAIALYYLFRSGVLGGRR